MGKNTVNNNVPIGRLDADLFWCKLRDIKNNLAHKTQTSSSLQMQCIINQYTRLTSNEWSSSLTDETSFPSSRSIERVVRRSMPFIGRW